MTMNKINIKNAMLIKFYSENKDIDIIRNYVFHHIMNGKYIDRGEKFKLTIFFAENKNINLSIQRTLSMDRLRTIRCRLARNPNIDISIQKILVNDHDPEVRCALVYNGNLDTSIIDILRKDENADIRFACRAIIDKHVFVGNEQI
jgi:hypothetical protein